MKIVLPLTITDVNFIYDLKKLANASTFECENKMSIYHYSLDSFIDYPK